jgi:hypothetical protein
MTKGRKRKNTPRSGKLPGVPKFKIWFPAEPFFDIVLKDKSDLGLENLARRMGVPKQNLKKLNKPGVLIRESTADAYAIKAGYHPMMIWSDWFDHEPEGGSNPKKRKPLAKGQAHIVYTDTTQPQDYNQ